MFSSRRFVVDTTYKWGFPLTRQKNPEFFFKCLCSTTVVEESESQRAGNSTKKCNRTKTTPDYYQSKWYNKETELGITGKALKKAEQEKRNNPADKFMKLWNHSEQMANNMARAGIQFYRGSKKGPNFTEKDDFSIEYKIPNLQENIFQLPQKYFDALQAGRKETKEKGTKEIIDYTLSESISFHDLNITSRLVEKLELRGITEPLPIQEIAIPTVVRGKTIVFQSETGSGKTLVFLLPVLQDPGQAFGTIIMVPTRELVSQMMHEAQSLLKDKSIVASFVSGVDQTEQERILNNTTKLPRIAIATPRRMWEIVRKYTEHFTKTKRIVIDEVDKVLLPISLKASKERLKYRGLKPRPGKLVVEALQGVSQATLQLIASSATVDRLLIEELEEMGWGDDIEVVKPATLQGKGKKVPPSIKHMFVTVDEVNRVSKASLLGRLFRNSGNVSALVFVRSTASVDEFMWELREYGIKAEALYKRLEDSLGFGSFLEDFRSGKIELVVANEETVRGLDLPDLEHVYLVEVPKNPDHYVHLAGRVGRQGKKGTCTTLVTNSRQWDMKRLLNIYGNLNLVCEEVLL